MRHKIYTREEAAQRIRESTKRSQKATMTAFTFRFHNKNDAEVIAHLGEQENKADYIRQLILKDLKGNKH